MTDEQSTPSSTGGASAVNDSASEKLTTELKQLFETFKLEISSSFDEQRKEREEDRSRFEKLSRKLKKDVHKSFDKLSAELKDDLSKHSSRIDRRLTDIESELSAQRYFAGGPGAYRPSPGQVIPTGGSVIEPIDAWRRKPGY